jgi:hypothetical protein
MWNHIHAQLHISVVLGVIGNGIGEVVLLLSRARRLDLPAHPGMVHPH